MLKNHCVIAWRNISRNKIYSIINVLSLCLGLTACLVIYLVVHYEFSFDDFHPDKERIYRIVFNKEEENGRKHSWATVFPAVPEALHAEISGIDKLTSFYPFNAPITIYGDASIPKKFDGRTTAFTESSCFDIFKYQWLAGNPANALKEPFKVVITESKAHLYFGSLSMPDIIGREIVYDDSLHTVVTGIVKDWNGNTDINYTDFISLQTLKESYLKNKVNLDSWTSNDFSPTVFVKLEKGTMLLKVNSQCEGFMKRHKALLVGPRLSMHLQPLTDIHFTRDFNRDDGILHWDGDSFRKAHLPTLYGLMGGALFILIIAVVNFMNLSTAMSFRRAKEVGVRKILGGRRGNIVVQFLVETFILTLIAFGLSVVLVSPVLSAFSSYIPGGLRFEWLDASMLIFILLMMAITSLLAGLYPAKVLSSYSPALNLRSASGLGKNSDYMRKGLIVFQFAISLIFIVGAMVIGNQIRFMQNELSFTQGKVISLWGGDSKNASLLASKIKQLSGVSEVARQGFPPIGMARMILPMKTQNENDIGVSVKSGNENFIPLYNLKLLAGRNLLPGDSLKEFVINRTFSKIMGFEKPEEAIGRKVSFSKKSIPVVGVVEDFHEGSFHEAIEPVVIGHDPQFESNVVFKVQGIEGQKMDLPSILSEVEKQWKQVYPDRSFNSQLLDDGIAWLYEKEVKASNLMQAAMMITIFISCIGVFGLSMFSAQVRTKEIGIRKVLGATVSNIVSMLGREFVLLVFIATLISFPIAWYFMNNWLEDFVYHINMNWWVFFLSGSAAMTIALVTISFQSIKAALSDPVNSLRSE